MPIRTHAEGDQGPIYRAFEIGNLADLIMLDTRLHGRDKGLEYAADMPLRSQAFEVSASGEAQAINDEAAQRLPADAVRRVRVPFDFSSGAAQAVLDYATIKDLDESSLPANWRYLLWISKGSKLRCSTRQSGSFWERSRAMVNENAASRTGRRQHLASIGSASLDGAFVFPRA